MRVLSFFLVTLVLALLLGPAEARAQLQRPGGNAMSVQLEAETRSPAPGETIKLALRMTPKPGWHG